MALLICWISKAMKITYVDHFTFRERIFPLSELCTWPQPVVGHGKS